MPFGQGFLSEVKHHYPNTPVKLASASSKEKSFTLKDIIGASGPEFQDGHVSVLNPLLFNGHLQTAYAAAGNFDEVDKVHYGRTLLEFPDGGSATADYVISKELYEQHEHVGKLPPRTRFFTEDELAAREGHNEKPIILVLHGLSGGSYESYVRCLVSRLNTDEFDAVVLNSRGCSRSQITTPQLFCGFWTDDVRFLVNELKAKAPSRPIYGVGFSLGATILSNYIGQEAEDCGLTAAAVFGNPWDMAESSYMLHRSWLGSYLYSPVMAKNLKKLLKRNHDLLSQNPRFLEAYKKDFDNIKTLSDFDNAFTSQMFGFNTAYEYYRHASPVNRLLSIRIPTLIVNALDDPIVGSDSLPYQEVEKNPYVTMVTTTYGGHLGWFKTNNERWYAQPIVDFFKSFHSLVKLDDQNGKAQVQDEGDLPYSNCFEVDRLNMTKNPYTNNFR